MTNTTYSKDRERIFQWAMGTLGIIAISFLGMIYNENKETNKRITDILIAMAEDKKDIQNAMVRLEENAEHDKEQDRRISIHDELLFLKPEDVKLKFNQQR